MLVESIGLRELLARYEGSFRLALDAYVACLVAERTAWEANDSPSDGTRNRLQSLLREARLEAHREVERAARQERMGEEAVRLLCADARRFVEVGS